MVLPLIIGGIALASGVGAFFSWQKTKRAKEDTAQEIQDTAQLKALATIPTANLQNQTPASVWATTIKTYAPYIALGVVAIVGLSFMRSRK